jgi:hypothetical protein
LSYGLFKQRTAPFLRKSSKVYRVGNEWAGNVLTYAATHGNRGKPNHNKRTRIPIPNRMKASIIMMRRKGCSINLIANFTGMCTSFVGRTIRKAIMSRSLCFLDLRKLPDTARKLSASYRRRMMDKLRAGWEAFILGEVDRPP